MTGVGVGSTGDVLTNDYRVIGRDIYFGRRVDGYPVLGVSRLIVSVGDQSRIEAVNRYYKEIKPVGTVALRPVEEALADVRANRASSSVSPQAKRADITQVLLAYWEDAGAPSEQPYLQPVWVFRGKAEVNGGDEPFDAIVPAASELARSSP